MKRDVHYHLLLVKMVALMLYCSLVDNKANGEAKAEAEYAPVFFGCYS